jgi:2-hydroxy-6-oxonona-2,4-dienedioate hydrolase
MIELFGVSKEAQAAISAEEMEQTEMFLSAMLPMSDRLDGIAVDQSRSMPRDYPLEEITAPTLVLHSQDDKLIPYENGQHSASKIPGAELVSFEQGGHLMMGNFEAINAEVTTFLAANMAE